MFSLIQVMSPGYEQSTAHFLDTIIHFELRGLSFRTFVWDKVWDARVEGMKVILCGLTIAVALATAYKTNVRMPGITPPEVRTALLTCSLKV